jgi:hypothetical protein
MPPPVLISFEKENLHIEFPDTPSFHDLLSHLHCLKEFNEKVAGKWSLT